MSQRGAVTIVPVVISAVGVGGAAVGNMVLAVTEGNDVAAWLSGGGAAAAVAGLAYIAKRLASGELVAVPLARVIEHADKREERLLALLDDANQREDAYRALLVSRGIAP